MITLQDRVAQLEKENRRSKRLLMAALICVGAAPLLAFSTSKNLNNASFDIVYASKFVVKDPRTGATRATLAHQTKAGGWAGITLWDNDGQPRAEFKLWEDGRSHLLMMDEQRNELSLLAASPTGDTKLRLGSETLLAGSATEQLKSAASTKQKR